MRLGRIVRVLEDDNRQDFFHQIMKKGTLLSVSFTKLIKRQISRKNHFTKIYLRQMKKNLLRDLKIIFMTAIIT